MLYEQRHCLFARADALVINALPVTDVLVTHQRKSPKQSLFVASHQSKLY